jgi:hypothetical protein
MSSISTVQLLIACGLCREANQSCPNTMFAGRRNCSPTEGSNSLYRRRSGIKQCTSGSLTERCSGLLNRAAFGPTLLQ